MTDHHIQGRYVFGGRGQRGRGFIFNMAYKVKLGR